MTTNNSINVATGAASTVLTGQGVGSTPTFSATPSVTSITLSSGTALSTYVQSTWTPVLSFGAGTTGITYSAQTGEYTQIGNVVHFALHITLSNKGSSTGNAAITLPVANGGGTLATIVATVLSNITFGALNTFMGGYVQGTAINITQSGSAQAFSALTNTAFANNTDLYITGTYFTS